MIRYQVAPLLARLGIDPADPHATRTLAAALRIDRRNACRLLVRGGITGRSQGDADATADRYAIALGVHPSAVWPDWWARAHSDEATPGWFDDDLDDVLDGLPSAC